MTLNDRGRALLKDHPGGLHVKLAITASTFDGAQQFTMTKTTMLHPPQLLVIPNIGLFPGAGTTLDRAGRSYVGAVVGVIQDATKVECEGYTDNTVSGKQAHDLALKRAQAVCDALGADGLSAPTSAISFGASRPLASNATAAGRARNRRVEIRVWF
jgi:outer membrane protein OmpA-like peptidoglycan-associated protein